MKVFVKTNVGKIISYVVAVSDFVTNLKIRIRQDEGIPINLQRLIFAGKQLEEGSSLSAYNIQNESTLYLMWRLSGR